MTATPTLFASLEAVQVIFDAIPSPVFLKNRQHVILMANRAFTSTFSRAASAMEREEVGVVGGTAEETSSPEQAAIFHAIDDRVFATGELMENEEVVTDHAGQQRHVITRKQLVHIPDAEGVLVPYLVGVISDVSRIMAAEQALRASDAEARAQAAQRQAIFDSARDAIMTLGPDGRIETANRAALALFGFSADELVGRNIGSLLNLGSGVAPSDGQVHEFDAATKDGAALQIDVSFGELAHADGVGRVAVLRDSTERRRTERAKNEFISTVSHELRTPLTSIAGSLGLLAAGAAGPLPDRAARLVTIAESNSRRLVRLINDILDMEKMQSGLMTFTPRALDLAALGRRTIESMAGIAAELGVSFVQTPSDPVLVQGDSDRLTQALTNLLSNAAKFSPRGGRIELVIEARSGQARLSVRDQGPGIPAAFQGRIFGKFAQAEGGDARQKGTGLGLAITRQIVEHHGGRIWFESPPGQGATFHIDLPLAASAQAPLDGPRLLLCEDDPDVGEVLVQALALQGFAVHHVTTIAAAEAALAGPESFAGLLLDLHLPDGDGLDLLKRLRSRPETCALPVIVVTADSRDGSGAALEVVDWIQKPIDLRRLQSSLGQVLESLDAPLILHIDDDPDLRLVVGEAFRGQARMIGADSLRSARASLRTVIPDVVILDVGLPDGSGLELLSELVDGEGRALPVVIFSGQALQTAELQAAVGAVLTKSRTPMDQLVRTVRRLSNKGPALRIVA